MVMLKMMEVFLKVKEYWVVDFWVNVLNLCRLLLVFYL